MIKQKFYNRFFLLLLGVSSFIVLFTAKAHANTEESLAKFTELERDLNGRLGVFAIDTKNNTHLEYRGDEHFPVASTFKAILAADILARSEKNPELMQQHIKYTKDELVSHSPVTEKHVEKGMSVTALWEAMLKYSDNTATNLLMKIVDGPAGVTRFAKSIDNKKFRLDNWEVLLNTDPNSEEDTCTPKTMAHTLQKIALGDFLKPELRKKLQDGLISNTVADKLIRDGVPSDWKVGDRSGGGAHGTRNDIAVIWPPNRAPIVLAIYTNHAAKDAQKREDILAAATRVVVKWAQSN